MTNIFGTAQKRDLKRKLFKFGEMALQNAGWRVERIQGSGKASVRRITKGGASKIVSIRTTQDTWIAFPFDRKTKKWVTLSEVDDVVAVSVDDRNNPKFAKVHLLDGDDLRDRFDRSLAARERAGYEIPERRGMWLSLYLPESAEPPTHVGAGIGLKTPPVATYPLTKAPQSQWDSPDHSEAEDGGGESEAPLTIAEAKRRLSESLGVPIESIKITIEH